MTTDRFHGHIAGIGTASGTRLVVGAWAESPYGPFTDVMIETGDGVRMLLAPSPAIADYVTATYTFDTVRVEPVMVTRGGPRWGVETPSLRMTFTVGRRASLGFVLRAVPGPVAQTPLWARAVAPVARLVMPGVRTVGSARDGRIEYYGAIDLHRITAATATLDGADLGTLSDVDPPCRFGFSSTPRRPSLTRVVTTVRVG